MIRHILALAVLLALAASAAFAEKPKDDFSWIRGANYVPSYARNDVQTWIEYNPAVIDKELGYAEKMRLNTVRVFLQFAVYEKDPAKFTANFENFLSLCKKHHIQMMPAIFDSCFGDAPDNVNYKDKDWMANPGPKRLGKDEWPKMEKYVRDIVGGHKNDKRIVLWDVMNEPYANVDRTSLDDFITHFCAYVKEQKPIQPTGLGWAFSGETRQWAENVDVLCIHNYAAPAGLQSDITSMKEFAAKADKPLIINEVVMRPQQTFESAMPILEKEKIGWCFWELMLGKTQFSRGDNPIQGVIYPDGTCRDADEIAVIMKVSLKQALRLFPERPNQTKTGFVEDGVTFKGGWTRWTGSGPRNGRLFYCTTKGATASVDFIGEQKVTIIYKQGPDCGIARILLDGKMLEELDTYSPEVNWAGQKTLDLTEQKGKHTVSVEVAGRSNAKSSNCYVQVVGLDVQNK